MKQVEIFPQALPPGLSYREDFISVDEERQLLSEIQRLALKESQYRQYTARRRTVNYGFSYDFTHLQSKPAPPIPEFLTPLRARAAQWADVRPENFVQALIAEYQPGTPLGWHRDVPDFEVVVGISLAGTARLRFRPYPWSPEKKSQVFALELAPRSAYILRDQARWGWQHHVPPTKELRYSITFRTASDKIPGSRQQRSLARD
ncbi:2OG-Fe(II) oxygenase [Steroidobacter agaridevorans]|uniref:2OG-Fe(II) oxygenase n=1 Tax=Steroidobacter agaridevorans TaxID=2695856 RepID=A0A829YKZ7_9GAMM|nr:alpha-ketoglutarate-dependent dioxygenase AlkB [Steroidobacter agaridevorans]GFE83920.1 2OG-Fe(II) oxygenase [Steroidobacter agaridevorans]